MPKGWLHYSNLKVEAAVFMLIALTFAAVLGQNAITSKQFDLTAQSGQYYPFVYGDKDDGGKSSITFDKTVPLTWSCTLRPGAEYTYCGYGLQIDTTKTGVGFDMTPYQNIALRLNYTGVGAHLRLLLQNAAPPSLADKVKKGETIPFVAEFSVVPGENDIHLTKSDFTIEPWWLTSHKLTAAETNSALDHIVSVAFSSGSETPYGKLDVVVKTFTFKGVSLTTAQWYLVILGVWLVMTGAFLVYRFLGLRRAYEARQRFQAEEARVLSEARAAAESASAAKSQFLANMSHELRTPLNAILGYAQLLKASDLSEQHLSAARTIQHSGEHLLTMITDILDIAKVEAGRLELLPAACDIGACVHDVAQMVSLRAAEKGLRFVLQIGEDVPAMIVADQKRLRQVLINLLGNAIKFTETGEVRLEVCVVSIHDGQVRLRFDVVDSGIGIPAGHIDRIFRPFEQSGNAIARSGGTGLGLSITHQIVQIMGGAIKVDSVEGRGSRFSVEADFPLAGALGGANRGNGVTDGRFHATPAWCGQYEILVVDNNAAVLALLRQSLAGHGFRVADATDGQQALDRIEMARPDLVIMDVNMPVLDGLHALACLRNGAATAGLPVIMMSADHGTEVTALAAGANRVVLKPIDLAGLASSVADLLGYRADQPAIAAPAEGADETVAFAGDMVAPDGEQLAHLLALAKAGNMRAIRREIPAIIAAGAQYQPFAARLDALAAAYQSPAVLRLIEHYSPERKAA